MAEQTPHPHAHRPTSPILLEKNKLVDGFDLQYKVPEDLLFFEGHFREAAVVAGVCELKWVADAIREHAGYAPEITAMEAVKFHQLLFPGQVFRMVLTYGKARKKWHFRITSGNRKVASGRLVIRN